MNINTHNKEKIMEKGYAVLTDDYCVGLYAEGQFYYDTKN